MFGKKKEPEFKFNLGDEAKDVITGFTGIITCRTQWLNNCNVYGLQPQKLKDGKPLEKSYFDEPQMELVEKKVHKESRKTGGPAHGAVQTNRP